MSWLLAGCCALALVGLSEALIVTQKPCFYGVKSHQDVAIFCISRPNLQTTVLWFKANEYNHNRVKVVEGERIKFRTRNQIKNSTLYITNVQVEDSGVYFCQVNGTDGPGTQLIVIRAIDPSQAQHRTTIKDVFIFLQGLLLAAVVAAILLRGKTVSEKTDIIYEEPETDHIYEGLAIERCDGGLYEELSVYAQADDTEAPWE